MEKLQALKVELMQAVGQRDHDRIPQLEKEISELETELNRFNLEKKLDIALERYEFAKKTKNNNLMHIAAREINNITDKLESIKIDQRGRGGIRSVVYE